MKRNRLTSVVPLFAAVALGGLSAASAHADKTKRAPAPAVAKAAAAATPQAAEKIRSVEGITEYRLANGLTVLLFPDPSKPNLTVNITYLVGSRHENYGETGMAHLLEHMVFKGTPRHPDVPKVLNSLGARFNGTTNYDRTNYFVTFPADDKNLETALDLEADRMVNSFIAKSALQTEFSVVRNELESGENNPFRVTLQRTISAAFDWHNYGKSTIGSRADIENVDISRLQAFYHKYYQPDNAILLIAGKLDESKTLGLVERSFGAIPRPSRVLEPTYTVDPVQDGERSITVRRVGDVKLVMLAYHIPALTDPDMPALWLLARILADEPAGRLYKALVETKKATAVFPFDFRTREPGIMLFGAEVLKTGNEQDVEKTAIDVLEGKGQGAVTDTEVERARTQLLKGIDLAINDTNQFAIILSGAMAAGDWRLFFYTRDALKQATRADVERVWQRWFKPSNRTVGHFLPTDKPERAPDPRLVSDSEVATLLKGYTGQAAVAQGEAFEATPANIERHLIRFTTSAGLKGVLLPKKTRGESVAARLVLRLGSEKTLSGLGEVPIVAAGMLMRGAGALSRQQIQDTLDRLKAQVFIGGDPEQVSVFINTIRPNLPEVLKLVATLLRGPTFPKAELDTLVAESIAAIEQQKTEPSAIAQLELTRHLQPFPKEHPRYTETPEESVALLKAVTPAAVKAFYQRFYGASAGELAVVGDFDAADIQRLTETLLGNWRAKVAYERIPDHYVAAEPVNQRFETPDKANAFFAVGLNLALKDTDAEYPALLLGSYMLGGGGLKSRIADRVRQKDGLSYGAALRMFAGPFEPYGQMNGFAIYNPVNVDRLEAAYLEELKRALDGGFTGEEIQAAKQSWLQGRQVSRTQDRELAARLASQLYLGRTQAFDAELEQKVAALGNAEILAALKHHLDPSRLLIFKAGDFAKKSDSKPAGTQ